MIPLVQSEEGLTTAREAFGYGLSQATFAHDQQSDQSKIYEELYSKVKNGDVNGVRYILGINDEDSCEKIQAIQIQIIKDQKKNTLLMHAVWGEQTQLFCDLIQYSLLKFDLEKTQQWITEVNEAGNQCMHIAAQKGNLTVLETIQKLNIKLSQKQKHSQTCLHIAAQSDYPALIYFFVKIAKIDINITDNELRTPLHIASYNGCEQAANLLLAFGAKVNQRDGLGMTALHLTATSGEQRITKKLLLYNAKPWLINQNRKTAQQIAIENDYQMISQMIQDYLEGNLKCSNICGLKNQPKINKKVRIQLYEFSLLIFFNLIYQILFTIGNNIYGYLQIISDLLLLIIYIWIIHSNPGYQKQYKDDSKIFYQMLQNNEKKLDICPECQTLKAQRTKHCYFCDRCVIVYDHHCPWINNCIGAKNHFLFIIFIQITLFTVGLQLFISLNIFIGQIWKGKSLDILNSESCQSDKFDFLFNPLNEMRNKFGISMGVEIEYSVFQIIITLMFTILLVGLFVTQINNIMQNKTTFERLNKRNRKQNYQQLILISIIRKQLQLK